MKKLLIYCAGALLVLSLTTSAGAIDFTGTTKLGWIFLDEEGSAAVDQPAYNIFDGPAFSLERFNLMFDNGLKVYGDLKNVTLNNRNLRLGLTKKARYGLTFNNYQYRQYYSHDGADYTRRRYYQGQAWVEPIDGLRAFGGFGQILKKGISSDYFEHAGLTAIRKVDYTQSLGNFGLQFNRDRHYFKMEYRLTDYSNWLDRDFDQLTSRLRFYGSAPIPTREDLFVNAGYQHYTAKIENKQDTLIADAFWGGVEWFGKKPYSVKYSFLFDRSRRTGDLSATDNILHALYLTRSWIAKGSFTIGYRYQTTDDVHDETSQNGYFASGWYKPMTDLTLKAGYGNEQSNVISGRTLNGEKSRTKFWAGLKYKHNHLGCNLMLKNRSTDNDKYAGWDQSLSVDYPRGISYSTDYTVIATDLYYENKAVGMLTISYSYSDGDYTNDVSKFAYHEHALSGDFESREIASLSIKFGGIYVRAKEDVDYERSDLHMGAEWNIKMGYGLEFKYTALNFDNYNDPSPIYTEYHTANVFEINLVKEL